MQSNSEHTISEDDEPISFFIYIDLAAALVFVVPTLCYAGYYIWFYGGLVSDAGRFSAWTNNFSSLPLLIESITSIFFVLAIPILLIYNELRLKKSSFTSLLLGFIGFNSILVLLTAIAHEARLFALPLLLYYPMSGKLWLSFHDKTKRQLVELRQQPALWRTFLVQLFGILLCATAFAYTLYNPADSGGCYKYYKIFLSLLTFFVFGSWLLRQFYPQKIEKI